MKHTYQKMLLIESSCELLTINTHLGLFKPMRLAFGVNHQQGLVKEQPKRN